MKAELRKNFAAGALNAAVSTRQGAFSNGYEVVLIGLGILSNEYRKNPF